MKLPEQPQSIEQENVLKLHGHQLMMRRTLSKHHGHNVKIGHWFESSLSHNFVSPSYVCTIDEEEHLSKHHGHNVEQIIGSNLSLPCIFVLPMNLFMLVWSPGHWFESVTSMYLCFANEPIYVGLVSRSLVRICHFHVSLFCQ